MCTLPIYGIHVIESTNICMCDDFMRHNMCTCVFMMFFTFFNTCIRIKHVHVFNPRFWSHFVSSRESFFFLHNINLFMLDDFEFSYKFSRSIYTKLHDFYVCLLVCHFFSFLCTFKPVSMVNRALTVMVKDRKLIT